MSGKFEVSPRAQMLMELLAEEFDRDGYGDHAIIPSFEHGAPTSIYAKQRGSDDYVFAAVVDGKWTQGVSVDDE